VAFTNNNKERRAYVPVTGQCMCSCSKSPKGEQLPWKMTSSLTIDAIEDDKENKIEYKCINKAFTITCFTPIMKIDAVPTYFIASFVHFSRLI
jgi:hypothetical protein